MLLETLTYATPVDNLTIVFSRSDDLPAQCCILAAGFCPPPDLLVRLVSLGNEAKSASSFGPIDSVVSAFLDGDGDAFESLPVQQPGTLFQQEVWAALRSIPVGTQQTYADVAKLIDRPSATRAVGTACGKNLVAPIVPCHRVVRSNGSLGGYYYGLAVKTWLLDHESTF